MNTTKISKVTSNIFIGNKYAILEKEDVFKENNIDVVISALTEEEYEDDMIGPEDFENLEWHRFDIDDCQFFDIYSYLFEVHFIIQEAVRDGKRIFIHCAAGVSRSATLLLAYFMLEKGMQCDDAVEYLKKYRPEIDPNPGFMRQLYKLENEV